MDNRGFSSASSACSSVRSETRDRSERGKEEKGRRSCRRVMIARDVMLGCNMTEPMAGWQRLLYHFQGANRPHLIYYLAPRGTVTPNPILLESAWVCHRYMELHRSIT